MTSSQPRYCEAIVLSECLGYSWDIACVHRSIEVAEGLLFENQSSLYLSGNTANALAVQFANVATHADGSVRCADIWFRTDLPARSTRVFELRNEASPFVDSSLKLERQSNTYTISNAHTAVRLPASCDCIHANEQTGVVAGPLLGVKLPSGQWTASSQLHLDEGRVFEGFTTEIIDHGPIVIRLRVTARFNAGSYVTDFTLFEDEPLVRIDERYENAGELAIDFQHGLDPALFTTKADFRGGMREASIDSGDAAPIPSLTGWDFYLPEYTSTIGFFGGPQDDLLAWMSTDADWLPDPYNQTFAWDSNTRLTARGSLKQGHRHWAFLTGKGEQFPDTGQALHRWWTKNIVVPLDKVINWQLEWPGMDDIAFPHTFFDAQDLPQIRERLKAEPAIAAFMEEMRDDGTAWETVQSVIADWPADEKERFANFEAKYRSKKGLPPGISTIAAAYLYFADDVYLEQLADNCDLDHETTIAGYLNVYVRSYLEGIGAWDDYRVSSMHTSDNFLTRYVGLEMLLGSELLSKNEKRDLLRKLAFATYVIHESHWQPPIHMPDGSVPKGYQQGTPNQKHCAFSARAYNACILSGHPMQENWLRFAMDELRGHYPWTINESGALLESPFYSSRDTIRYGPFWAAMTRAGVASIAPDYEQWMERPKKAFEYLVNMLTPKEPRMGGRRVYHPIGRSSTGVVDATFMIGAEPWGRDDAAHAALMSWAWEQQGCPSPDVTGTTGGRDLSLTLLAFSQKSQTPYSNPLRSRRYEGMGAVLRSNPESSYESNVVWRHDGFAWDLYAVNNGALYFYGKGAPLLPRFGAYWSHSYGGAWMMDLPFGNRIQFDEGNNDCFGRTTQFANLGEVCDVVAGITDDGHWKRSALFCKDTNREDPVYLLVRDDIARPGCGSSLNWWFMTKNVAPHGLKKPGVVPIEISHDDWVANIGKNWREAPTMQGQLHHFPGMTGVDIDLYIATPENPQIRTDAASTGKFPYNIGGSDLYETQQLVQISQLEGRGYLTLLAPRWPDEKPRHYTTIPGGAGVKVKTEVGEDWLFLCDQPQCWKDERVTFNGRCGLFRDGGKKLKRLMINAGSISADGFTLSAQNEAALVVSNDEVRVMHTGPREAVELTVPPALSHIAVQWEHRG